MQIDFSRGQMENADASIRVSLDPDSNFKVERFNQFANDSLHKTSTEAGMQSELNFVVGGNILASICLSLDPDWNDNDVSKSEVQKHCEQRISILRFTVTFGFCPK
jgi:hypothetical protein